MKKIHKETELILINNEKEVLEDLKKLYARNLKEVQRKIERLMIEIERMEKLDPTSTVLRSRRYQLNYQKALEQQIDNLMKALGDEETFTVENYLQKMYEDGYITQQYVINQLGIPVITPINVDKLIEAVNQKVDGYKFSTRLYDNVEQLGTVVKNEVASGIIQGKSYIEIADRIRRDSEASLKRAYTIARTEGGRVSSLAKVQSQMDAKKKGADIVKQWDATLDNKTRPEHIELDGQIREIGKPFEIAGYKAQAPRLFGVAHLDINCRCISLTLPRWDIEEEYYKRDGLIEEKDLKEAYEKAKAEGRLEEVLNSPEGIAGELRKVKNYKDWKERYHEAIKEKGYLDNGNIRKGTNVVDLNYINSSDFSKKFNKITGNTKINDAIRKYAKSMLTFSNGKDEEDLFFINSESGELINHWHSKSLETHFSDEVKNAVETYKGKIIALHNHPTNLMPTGSDYVVSGNRQYAMALVVTHDGRVFKYAHGDIPFASYLYDKKVAKNMKLSYNVTIEQAQKEVLEELRKEYGILCEELK